MAGNEKTVIVIEDEADAAEMFAEMMRVSGFLAIKTYSSIPAIDLIRHEIPDVVLLDVMMPGVSGLEVPRVMRREPDLKAISVIVISAKGNPSDIKTGMDAGASLHLTKPVGFLDLKQAVDRALGAAQS